MERDMELIWKANDNQQHCPRIKSKSPYYIQHTQVVTGRSETLSQSAGEEAASPFPGVTVAVSGMRGWSPGLARTLHFPESLQAGLLRPVCRRIPFPLPSHPLPSATL